MPDKVLEQAVAALLVGIDVPDAEAQLAELGLGLEFSTDSLATIQEAEDVLTAKARELKIAEAPASQRKAVRAEVNRLINAKALLYRLRVPQAGDVVVSLGGNN